MKPVTSHLVIIVHIAGVLSTINCPLNETEWKARSKTKLCQGSDVYHCLLVEDGKIRREKCIEKTLIMDGHCPIFTHDDYLHWKTCNTEGCPTIPFRSDEVYKYPLCYGSIENKDEKILGNEQLSEDSNDNLKIGIPVGITAFVVIAAIVLLAISRRRRFMTCKCLFCDSESGNGQSELVELIGKPKKPAYLYDCLELLKHSDVLYLFGQLGNSVSTSGKKVTEQYATKHKMKHMYFNYLDIPEEFPDETVFFIDGWCGLWNENPCERGLTLERIENIAQQCNSEKNTKFVIGLRTEIKEKYKTEFANLKIRMTENETYSLDISSHVKRKTVSKKINTLKTSCRRVNCECRSLNQSKVSNIVVVPIGVYLIIDLLDLDHDMIPDFLDETKGPLLTMQSHFERLLEDKPVCFLLLYIVLIGHLDVGEFRQEIGDALGFSITDVSSSEKIDKYTKEIPKSQLAPMWSQRMEGGASRSQTGSQQIRVFWHNFLYICAFRACYRKYPREIMKYCNLDAILQLVRPRDHGEERERRADSEDFTIQAGDEFVDIFCEERVKDRANDSTWSEHPLIQEWKKRKGI